MLSACNVESPELIPCMCNPEADSTLGIFDCMCEPAKKKPVRRISYLQDTQKINYQTLIISDEQYNAYTTIGGTPHLDGLYTVFGEVMNGLDVVDRIQNVPCDKNNRPLDDVRILKVELLKNR